MEEKLRNISISDVTSKRVMIEMAAHLAKYKSDKKRKWLAQIVSKDTYQKQKKEIKNLPDVVLYASEYEILYTLAHGYLKGLDVVVNECEILKQSPEKGEAIMYVYSAS